jgi:RNA polymerase sigma-70 factor (ECF subfamily)
MTAPRPSEPPLSLDWLIERYRAPLNSFFRRRVGSTAEAEDLTQEVFLRVVSHNRATSVEMAEGFIFTIAGNLLRDRARRARTRRAEATFSLDDEAADSHKSPDLTEGISPERVLIAKEALSQVLSALNGLPPRTREMLVLYRLEGLRKHEIAALYGVTVSAVEKQIVKALAQLARR